MLGQHGIRPSSPRGPLQPAERGARYGPDDGAFCCGRRRTGARVVATRAPMILVTPAGDSVEPPACGASNALDVPAYRSAACVASAVSGGGVKVPMTAMPAGGCP